MTIEDYLNELCPRLTVDPLRRDEIRLETHLHLRDRTAALQDDGISAEDAETRAIEEFGDAETVAASLSVRQPAVSRQSFFRHGDFLAALLTYSCIVDLFGFIGLYVNYPQHQVTYDAFVVLNKQSLINFSILYGFSAFFKLLFAVALLQKRQWARYPLMLASIGIIASLFFVQTGAALDFTQPLTQIPVMATNIAPPLFFCVYALWVMHYPRRSRVFESL